MNAALILPLGVGVMVFGAGYFVVAAFASGGKRSRAKVRSRLDNLTATQEYDAKGLLRDTSVSHVFWLNRFLGGLSLVRNLGRTVRQAGLRIPPAVIVLASVLGLVVGYLLGEKTTGFTLAGVGGGLVGAWLPFKWVARKRTKRMDRFQEQLPDALDLVGRALRAGHAFSGALRLLSDEFDNPIAGEFETTLDEINFGVSTQRALRHLCERVDVPDLKFFVVSVNIQRETGGNLAEIVTTIAILIRERFKIKGKVKVLSAEGRLSALVLVLLPICVAIFISIVNPGYLNLLATTALGNLMVGLAVIQMLVGIFFIRKMIRIEV